MKRLFGLLALVGVVLLAAGCNGKATTAPSEESAGSNSDVLVAYFSATGTTAKEAKKVAEATGGTLFEIAPVQPYSDADLDYQNENSRSTVEQHDSQSRPEIKDSIDIAPYDTVYLGFPIWWYDAPRIIYTFLDSYDFSGKKIVVFATAGSSSLQSSFEALKAAYPHYDLVEGAVYNAGSKPQFKEWVESLKQ